ncbi:MAG: hypothetical protein DRO73_05460 [Candidatus Thorarchaeota archaeon]|nr:MAG: hypothetical protein DRO73_05460 [Candidatus Thorarchaeota archaeon]
MTDYSTRDLERYRTVSDLRVQKICEYRLFLKQRHGNRTLDASREGAHLHSKVRTAAVAGTNRILAVMILILTVILGALWLLG